MEPRLSQEGATAHKTSHVDYNFMRPPETRWCRL